MRYLYRIISSDIMVITSIVIRMDDICKLISKFIARRRTIKLGIFNSPVMLRNCINGDTSPCPLYISIDSVVSLLDSRPAMFVASFIVALPDVTFYAEFVGSYKTKQL